MYNEKKIYWRMEMKKLKCLCYFLTMCLLVTLIIPATNNVACAKTKKVDVVKMSAFSVILLKGILKNPDSLSIYSIKKGKNESKNNRIEIIIDYSAQNGYGGDNRDKATFFYSDESPDDKYWIYDEVIDPNGKAIRLEMYEGTHFLDSQSKISISDVKKAVKKYEKSSDPFIHTPD
jgi:hypothetical protein